jgi:copper(I)-binding protein
VERPVTLTSPITSQARAVLAALAAAGLLASAGCSSTSSGTASQAASSAASTPNAVTVDDAVVVEPVTAGDPANILFTVVNGTAESDALTSVTSAISSTIVLNNTLSASGTTAPIPLGAHSSTALDPIGPDVWVFSPKTLRTGATVQLTVHFQHAAPLTVNAVVRTSAQEAQTSGSTSTSTADAG